MVAVTREGEWIVDLGAAGEDVSALARTVLGPVLGVWDERADHRVLFVPGYPGPGSPAFGGIEGGVGFLVHPPTVAAVMAGSDRGRGDAPQGNVFRP